MSVKKIDKARLIVQATRAWRNPPDANDPEVLETAAKLPAEQLEASYIWAKGAMSAMRWNTITLEMW